MPVTHVFLADNLPDACVTRRFKLSATGPSLRTPPDALRTIPGRAVLAKTQPPTPRGRSVRGNVLSLLLVAVATFGVNVLVYLGALDYLSLIHI